ncbi:hypothetical protein E2C01_033997 [Portunus trituberculatus]|uniref:Uncharacterized protein n=1 Tax=Portunus trituberculatus TaxID=210409 RepID=A0A5B7EZC9_PORTR|nr:hypothetical protein [Portunus trituberculatus]
MERMRGWKGEWRVEEGGMQVRGETSDWRVEEGVRQRRRAELHAFDVPRTPGRPHLPTGDDDVVLTLTVAKNQHVMALTREIVM